jgi:hypothetical protein
MTNYRKRHSSRAIVVSVTEKVQPMYQVWIKKTNTSEPPYKCRKNLDGVKTAELMLLQDEPGGNLFTSLAAPGIEVA